MWYVPEKADECAPTCRGMIQCQRNFLQIYMRLWLYLHRRDWQTSRRKDHWTLQSCWEANSPNFSRWRNTGTRRILDGIHIKAHNPTQRRNFRIWKQTSVLYSSNPTPPPLFGPCVLYWNGSFIYTITNNTHLEKLANQFNNDHFHKGTPYFFSFSNLVSSPGGSVFSLVDWWVLVLCAVVVIHSTRLYHLYSSSRSLFKKMKKKSGINCRIRKGCARDDKSRQVMMVI